MDFLGNRARDARHGFDVLDRRHGHGTGAMKSAVRDLLKRHPLIATVRAGDAGEGGDGVTMVKLVSA